jgi:1,2-dihydroxy-3-keto-5-methylthiopentene dioxygenase
MAIVRIPDHDETITEYGAAREFLASIGIGFERWDTARPIDSEEPAETVLTAYAEDIEAVKQSGGYVTADVIDVTPNTPGLEAMLARFRSEHWHDEDEVRFIIEGRGVFHINPRTHPIVSVEVGKGDLLRVPAGTWHWFDLCADRRIRAIRLFQNPSGWTPHYTGSGVDSGYLPVCLGLHFIPPSLQRL